MPEPTKPLLSKLANGIKNWFKKPAEPRPYKLDVSILEDRILYSATAMPMPDSAPMDAASLDMDAIEAALQSALTEAVDTTALQAATLTATQTSLDSPAASFEGTSILATESADPSSFPMDSGQADAPTLDLTLNQIDALLSETLLSDLQSPIDLSTDPQLDSYALSVASSLLPTDSSLQTCIHEVVFVQSSLLDVADLIDDIETEAAQRGHFVNVFVLDRLSNGFEQIDSILAQYDDLNAIHFVSHGTEGMIQLGGSWLTAGNVDQHFGELQRWGMALNDSGDILIYGCDVAQGLAGQTLIEAIADATHADVAASMDSTGNAARGGNWTLEMQVGQIETLNALSIETQESYGGLLTTYTVTNTNNSGAGSLRQAITDANNNAGADTIVFSIGSGVQTITLTSLLPSITGQVTIDGTTQSGFSGTPLIVITGGGTVTDGFQLYSGSDGSTIKGLVIRSFTQDGIDIASSNNNTIVGNYIGISQSGLSSSGNQQGVNLWAASNNTIGGSTAAERNIISGNSGYGVWIGGGGTGNQVRGNYIGTNYLGTGSLQNGNVAVYLDSANNTVGGTTSGFGNLISGNTSTTGLSLTSLATGSVVQGNIIGLSTSGTALANSVGISVSASNVTIGGTTAAARNVISGNSGVGIDVYGSGNTIQGNYVGVDTTGLTKVANGSYGIDMHSAATNTTIGGVATGARNIISGNGNAGVLFESGSNGSVLGNYIGVDSTGATSIAGNGAAIFIATNNVKVGGVNAGEGNIISGSNTDGIIITGSVANNSILGNSIWGNSGQAIDFNDDGITYNDIGDGDSGPNGLQNFASLSTATSSGGDTTITGKISAAASTTYRVEFFSNAYGSADSSGYGEGKTYLDAVTVTTDASGHGTISKTITGLTLAAGSTVTSTTTLDLGGSTFGSTSEFSGNIIANQANLMISGTYTGNGADNRAYTGLGFRPEAVIIIHGASTQVGVLRTSSMAGDASKVMTGATALTANLIQSLDGEGFTLGNDARVNTSGQVYHWIAFGAGDNIDVGAYTGNGTSQTVGGVGFQAEMTYLASAGTGAAGFNSSLSATNTYQFNNVAPVTNAITAYTSTGFTVGASSTANQSSTAIHYIAFNQNANYFMQGTYTGNGVDNRNITGLGFEAEFLTVRAVSGANYVPFKPESTGYNVDGTIYVDGTGNYTNSIQAIQADGFQVGTDNEVNGNGSTYAYFAFKQKDAPLIVDTNSDSNTSSDTSSINALRASRGADGRISLREAITATNATRNVNGTPDEINFAISGTGIQTISVGTTGLDSITDAVKIDAWTQSGWSSGPLIELNGGNTGTLKDGFHLASGSSGSTIRGFIVNRFTGDGIEINSSNNNVIEGNWIGLSNTGSSSSANALRGLYAINSTGLTIGGTSAASRNVISGNTQQGIYFDNIDNSFVYGNYVGTNATGTADINGSSSNTAQTGLVLINGSSGNNIGNSSLAGTRNVFSGNNHYGVEIQSATSTNNTVSGNYIGTDVTGLLGLGNVNGGFSFWGSGSGNLLANNVISANGSLGVLVGSGTASAQIQGNIIGLAADGTTSLGNTLHGILVTGASTNTLIGTNADGSNDAAEANTISGNANGIIVDTAGTTGTMIYGNFIGTTTSGNTVRGNTIDGIRIEAGATGTLVGGSGSARRNIIAGNGQDGVQIDGEATDGNTIQNNWIGLAADGVTVLGNGGNGIYISGGADNTVIGGIGLGNVIMGARVVGIEIDGASTGTSILGNLIGINAAGTVIQGSGQNGILLENGAASTTIGGTTAGQGNTIVDSGRLSATWQSGVNISSTAGASNSIIGNAIYDNRGLGIDIGTSGITANDNLDSDTGANNLQNTPVLTTATTNGSTVTVSGTLNTVASTAGILIHFYATPSTGTVNTRQGRRYLGSTTVSSNASGNATFSSVALSSAVTAGELITATTTLSSSTSEFSQAIVSTASAGNSAPSNSVITSTTSGGVTINSGSGNSTYLEAANGSSILGGRSQFSMEFDFQAEAIVDGRLYTFASYTSPTDGDVMFFGAAKSGASETINLQINGTLATITTADVDAIFDGNRHSMSATWSQTSGAWAIYLDGALLGSGTGLATGQTLATGGDLVIGQDMDAGGDTWQVNHGSVFKGTLYDVRFFNDVRTASEVAANYQSTLPFNESGMVANWRMNDLSTAGVITDAVSGNSLTARQMTSPSFTASTPTLSLATNENSTTGTIIGDVNGTDLDREARIAALLAADSSLRYSVETQQFYKVISSSGTWSAAQTGAASTTLNGVGGQLATITSATENTLITSMLTGTAWLGGSDSLYEGAWRWYSGSSAANQFWQGASTGYAVNNSYTNFQTAEPNDWSGNEDFLEINSAGQWNDSSSAATQGFYVVEWSADDVLDATNALTYTITSQTVSGAFSINSDSGLITVANGSLLDFETQASHTVNVRVTDGSGATYDKAFTVSLNNLTENTATPSDLSTGINLNTDSGNNAYLRSTSGGSVFGGLTAMTLEVEYTMKTPSSVNNTLISYASASGSTNNEVMLTINASGRIQISLNGTDLVSTAAFTQLLDGKSHALAVSWDNTNGDIVYYIDGQLVESNTGFKAGTTIAAGGTLAIGQDQDTVDGSYDSTQRFSGTLHDIRVWNRAISSEQVAQNYQQKLGDTPTGLVANWRMTALSSGTTVVDSVGGINLTVANITGGGWTTSTPTASLSISENATVGTIVGSAVVTEAMNTRDIVADGLFREATSPGSFANYTTGQTIGNWTVQSGDVDLAGTLWQTSPLGGRSIDLNGNNAGAISQVLSTTAGRQYQVIFNTTGNWTSGDVTKDFRVSAGGTSQDFSLTQPSGWSTSNMLFSGRSMTFTATGTSTTLAFQSLDPGNSSGRCDR